MTEAECAQLVERLDARLRELEVERAILEMKAEALRTAREAVAGRAKGGPPSCAACLAEIPRARLRAHPLAVRCRECEEGASSSSWLAAILAAVWTAF